VQARSDLRFMHETNPFSVQKTDWRVAPRDFHRDNEIPAAFRGTHSSLGATSTVRRNSLTLIRPGFANAHPPAPSHRDRRRVRAYRRMMLQAAERQQPIAAYCCIFTARMVVDSL